MNPKSHIWLTVVFVFLTIRHNSEQDLQLVSWSYVAPADAMGIILTSHEQEGALAFQVCFCFLGRICEDLGVTGASEAEELSAGVTRSCSLFTDGQFKEIPVVCSGCHGFHKVRGGWRKSPPTQTARVKTGARMILPFFRKS